MLATLGGCAENRRADFNTHGWLVLRGVVDPGDIEELNDLFDQIMAPASGASGATGSAVSLRPSVGARHPVLLRHLHMGLAQIAADVIGATSLRLLQDALLLKQPAAHGSIALHQDYAYTGFLDPPSMVAVGLALSDASEESGCLHVVDASHTWGLVSESRVFAGALQQDVADQLSPAQRDALRHRRLPLEVRAGDVTMHHCLTLHGSDDNRSTAPRKTILAHVFDAECRLVRERLPEASRQHFVTDVQGRLTGPAFPQLFPAGPTASPESPEIGGA